jgi:hypothetical protein
VLDHKGEERRGGGGFERFPSHSCRIKKKTLFDRHGIDRHGKPCNGKA